DTEVVAAGDELVMRGHNDPFGEIPGALTLTARTKVVTVGGTVRPSGPDLLVDEADEVTLLIAIATSYSAPGDPSAHPDALTAMHVAAAARRSFDTIAQQTAIDHGRLFDRVRLDLGTVPEVPTDERLRREQLQVDQGHFTPFPDYLRNLSHQPTR